MISLLQRIVDWFVCWVLTGIIMAVNYVILGLGALLEGLLALLPPMPDLPSVPSEVSTAFAYGKYWFPVDFFITLLAIFVALWLAWFIIAIPLRWAKATDQ